MAVAERTDELEGYVRRLGSPYRMSSEGDGLKPNNVTEPRNACLPVGRGIVALTVNERLC